MNHPRITTRRVGASAVEFAFVAPIAFFLLFSIIIGGLAVFRYQEVAHLAREASRYASVHGGLYERENVKPAIDEDGIRDFIFTRSYLLDPDHLTSQATWRYDDKMPQRADPDANPPGSEVLVNTVTVTVTYQWFPELFLVGPFTMTSTSEVSITY